MLFQPLFQFFCSRYAIRCCFLSGGFQMKGGEDFPDYHNAEGWCLPSIPKHALREVVFSMLCCISCESQVAMERFFQIYALATGAIQSLWKAMQTFPLIFMVLCHLQCLRSHPRSLLLHFQEILKSYSTYIREHQM